MQSVEANAFLEQQGVGNFPVQVCKMAMVQDDSYKIGFLPDPHDCLTSSIATPDRRTGRCLLCTAESGGCKWQMVSPLGVSTLELGGSRHQSTRSKGMEQCHLHSQRRSLASGAQVSAFIWQHEPHEHKSTEGSSSSSFRRKSGCSKGSFTTHCAQQSSPL